MAGLLLRYSAHIYEQSKVASWQQKDFKMPQVHNARIATHNPKSGAFVTQPRQEIIETVIKNFSW